MSPALAAWLVAGGLVVLSVAGMWVAFEHLSDGEDRTPPDDLTGDQLDQLIRPYRIDP